MVVERMVRRSLTWAAMGLSLAAVASGQDIDTNAAAGANANIGQDSVDAAANAAPGARVDANAGVNLDPQADSNRIGANAGVQSGKTQVGGELNADGTRADAQINADGTRSDVQLNGDSAAAGATNNVNGRSQLDVDVNGNRLQGGVNTNTGRGLNGHANRDAFGVTFDSGVTNGLVVQQALPNSAAARIGLRTGDRIIGFNGRTYSNADGFNADLDGFNSNLDTPIIYERDGRLYTRNVRLSSQNSVRNGSGTFDGGQSGSNQISHSVGRPIYGESGAMSGDNNGDYASQAGTSGYADGGNGVFQNASYHSRRCCDPCGHQHGRRGRHGRSWR